MRGLLHLQESRTDQGQRRQRAGQRLRSHRSRTVAHAIATLGGTRADQVRRARARDGGDARGRRSCNLRPRTDCRGDGGGGHRQVALVPRVQSQESVRLDGAGNLFGLSRQGVGLSSGTRSIARLFQNRRRGRSTDAARETNRPHTRARPFDGGYAAVPVQPAGYRRGRGSLGADGRAVEEAAHARSDQTDTATRVV